MSCGNVQNYPLNTCLMGTADCDLNTIPIGNSCYPYALNSDPTCTTFNIETQDLNLNQIGHETTSSVYDCLNKCSLNENCEGVRFNWETAECSQLGTGPVVGGGAGTGAFGVYSKVAGSPDCFNVVQGSDYEFMVDMSGGKPTTKIPKVSGDYIGSCCREAITAKEIDVDQNALLLNTMYEWCESNEDIDTCNKFCDMYPSVCPGTRDSKSFVYMGVFFAVLLLFIILMTRLPLHRKIILIVSIPTLIVLGIFAGMGTFEAITHTNPFPGGQKDYPEGSYPPPKQVDATVMYTCKSDTKSNTCVPDENGIWFGLKNCNDNCHVTCPPPTQRVGERCYQTLPQGSDGSTCGPGYATSCFNCSSSCQAVCSATAAMKPIPDGAYFCSTDVSYPTGAWTQCTNPAGCNLSDSTKYPCTRWSDMGLGMCYYAGVGDDNCSGPTTSCTWPPSP